MRLTLHPCMRIYIYGQLQDAMWRVYTPQNFNDAVQGKGRLGKAENAAASR